MEHIIFPDYERSILNTASSILRRYGAAAGHPTLPALDALLSTGHKNTVLMIFDGMGMDALERNLPPDAFLRRNIRQTLTSVFPSTTAAAMTSYYSALSPSEHGWLGWTLHFKEYGGILETYTNRFDSTKQSAGERSAAYDLMPYATIFERIHDAAKDVSLHFVAPKGIGLPDHPAQETRCDTADAMCAAIAELCAQEGEKLVLAYCPELDHIMHATGCASEETRATLARINCCAEALCAACSDTFFLISADHGLADMAEYIQLQDVPQIDECLLMPPSIESRAASLFAKPGMRDMLKERFEALYGDQFLLLPREEVFARGLFGPGTPNGKAGDFLGDFLACATGDIAIRYRTRNGAAPNLWKGQHGGLTAAEMVVPLIAVAATVIED